MEAWKPHAMKRINMVPTYLDLRYKNRRQTISGIELQCLYSVAYVRR